MYLVQYVNRDFPIDSADPLVYISGMSTQTEMECSYPHCKCRISVEPPKICRFTGQKRVISEDFEQAGLRMDLNPGLKPLSSLSTRHLMSLRDHCYKTGGDWYSPVDSNGPGYYMQDILAELSTREHVPSKREAQAARRAAQGRKEKKVRAY